MNMLAVLKLCCWVQLSCCWVLLSCLCFATSSSPVHVVYITPKLGNCTVNGTALHPCYTFLQLNDGEVLSSCNNGSVELVLLAGTHLIPVLNVSNFSQVVIHPWSKEKRTEVECKLEEDLDAYIVFQDVTNLNISTLNFTSCSIQYVNENSDRESRVNVENCIFRDSGDAALSSSVRRGAHKMSLSNCSFLSNYYVAVSFLQDHGSTLASLVITSTLFHSNGGDFLSYGALNVDYSSLTVRNSQFINNTGSTFVIYIDHSIAVVENALFYQNSVLSGDSMFLARSSSMNISNCHFMDNTAGIYIQESGVPSVFFNSTFERNHVNCDGGVIYLENTGVTIVDCHFKNNSAESGGSLYVKSSEEACFIVNSTFISNEAGSGGGAIYCKDYTHTNGFVYIGGGHSASNSAGSGGGFAYLSNCQLKIYNHSISDSIATNGGAIYASEQSQIFITQSYAHRPEIGLTRNPSALLPPDITLANNTAAYGGAFYLSNSKISFDIDTHLIFDGNVAGEDGGAIYVLDDNCELVPDNFRCFFIDSIGASENHLLFTNNNASQGPVLYGGLLDRCLDYLSYGIDRMKSISEYKPIPLAITSDPVRVCLCNDNFTLNCTTRQLTLSKMRGQTIDLMGAVVDQDGNPKESFIRAGYSKSSSNLGIGEGRKAVGNKCNSLSYHFFTSSASTDSATLILHAEGFCERSNFSSVAIGIMIKPCSRGFERVDDRCGCDKRLAGLSNIVLCNIDSNSIQRKGFLWLRYGEHLKVHANCPLDYCQVKSDAISLEFPDQQCANNHSGVICGGCQDNFSIVLGGSKCLQCTTNYTLIWLIPVFAVAGMLLVALLLLCNMTISHGTLNGLIFYANVVSITGLASLRNCSVHPMFSLFIAWVNLDFGVETCFYVGMDTIQKTWLQFAFPLYIWLLVGAIILASHYSATAMKVFGRRNMAILATLFLLSYAKILKTISTALTFTEVLQASANDTNDQLVPYKVWTYNGNIEYLTGAHIPLFTVALALLVFLFLPYTLLLMFGQCIRSMPAQRRCVLRCIRSTAFISIMDAYHAPYKKKHRYWTGLMLLTRCVLFLAFASSHNDDELLTNMYISTLVLTALFTLKACVPKMYQDFRINLLELSFLLNLMVLSATVYYLRGNRNNDLVLCQCTSASVAVSMATFVGILAYHAILQLNKTKCFMKFKDSVLAKQRAEQYHAFRHEEDTLPAPAAKPPTRTFVELREDLLGSEDNH